MTGQQIVAPLQLALLLAAVGCRSGVDLTPAHAEVDLPVSESFGIGRSGDETIEFPPFVRVIARPELYDGKMIQLIGYMNLEFEGNGIYQSEELFKHGGSADALWLDVEGMRCKPPFSRGWVLIEGTFNGERRGHFGMYAGTLEKITRMDAWRR